MRTFWMSSVAVIGLLLGSSSLCFAGGPGAKHGDHSGHGGGHTVHGGGHGTDLEDLDDLNQALSNGGDPVKVVFVNGETGETEYVTVRPRNGRLGVDEA